MGRPQTHLPRVLVIVPEASGDRRYDLHYLAPFGTGPAEAQTIVDQEVRRVREENPEYESRDIDKALRGHNFAPLRLVMSNAGW